MKLRIFLSHTEVDKPTVYQFFEALAPYGAYLWLDELELLPGDSLFGKIGREIDVSDRVLVFISESSIKSHWVQTELNTFLARELQIGQTLVIPVVLDSVNVPPFLNDRFQVRVSQIGFAKAVQYILKGIFRHHAVLLADSSLDKHKIPDKRSG